MKYIIALLLVILTLSSTTVLAQTKISVYEASRLLQQSKKGQLLDVRTPQEYNTKHISNSINLDWNDNASFEPKAMAQLNITEPVYVYCLSGGRSAQAAKSLTEKGFTVIEIEGGILKWEEAGLPLVDSTSTPSKGLTLKQFKELVSSEKMVLIDFYATWCGPCKEMGPIIKQITKEYAGKIKVVKVDVDQNSALTKQLGISSIPTLHLYKGGTQVWKKTGFTDKKTIEAQLK